MPNEYLDKVNLSGTIYDIKDTTSGYITAETDPTVPSWAKQSTKPSYTASEVSAVAISAVGAASGVAPLNASSKIDSTYLPSYVDDVIEGYYYNNKFYKESAHTTEITGETGKIYIDLATDKVYRYGGSAYAEIAQGSLVSVSRNLTSGTKIGTITINGTGTDLYAPSNTDEKVKTTLLDWDNDHNIYYIVFGNGNNTETKKYDDALAYSTTDDTASLKVGATDDREGALMLSNGASYWGTLALNSISANRTYSLPDATGTIALTSNIPNAGSTASAVGTSSSGGSALTWSRSDHIHSISSSTITSALGYTPYNSTNPNGYTTNTGTVTQITAGTGLSIGSTSGGNITTSGTINHTNSVTAQSTQAIYPITIDAQGHISGYGSAVTVAQYVNGQDSSPILSWTHTTVNGIDGVYLGYQDGLDIGYLFLPSGNGFNTGVQNILTQVSQNYVPNTRTVNGKALSADISLTASDVGALPSSTTIPVASTTTPSMDGTASYGSGTTWARADHVHPHDTSKVDKETIDGSRTSTFGTAARHIAPYMQTEDSESESGASISVDANGSNSQAYIYVWDDQNGNENEVIITPTSTTITNIITPTNDTDAANKKYVDDSVPTKTSDLTNDSGYLTLSTLPIYDGTVI